MQQHNTMNTPTPTPRTDTEITFTGAYTCTHHNPQQRAVCPVCLVTALTAERDQLRDEVERLTKQAVFDGDHIHTLNAAFATRAEITDAKARAERAEAAETVALANWNGALERAMKAEAELATERVRRDDLVADINDACITLASAKDDCDDYALLNTGFKLTAVRDVLIQYIPNAAMKEGAK